MRGFLETLGLSLVCLVAAEWCFMLSRPLAGLLFAIGLLVVGSAALILSLRRLLSLRKPALLLPVACLLCAVWGAWHIVAGVEARVSARAFVDGGRLDLAIQEWHKRFGEYPSDLEDLVPLILPALPRPGVWGQRDDFSYSSFDSAPPLIGFSRGCMWVCVKRVGGGPWTTR